MCCATERKREGTADGRALRTESRAVQERFIRPRSVNAHNEGELERHTLLLIGELSVSAISVI